MDEHSHKDEMRAALRGDFARLRERRGEDADDRPATGATPPSPAGRGAQVDKRPLSLERLLSRY